MIHARFFLMTMFVLALATLGASGAFAANYTLVEREIPVEASADSASDTPPVIPGVKRSRQVSLAPRIATPDGLAQGDVLTLNVFPDAVFTARIDKVTTNVNGTVTVRGRIDGYSFGYVLISTTDGKSLGTIEIPEEGRNYRIQSDPLTNAHRLMDMDPKQLGALEDDPSPIPPLPPTTPPAVTDGAPKALKDEPMADPMDPATIRVVIVYTPAAKTWADASGGGMANVIAQAMAKSQLALDNSNTVMTMELAHSAEVSYTESGTPSTDLNRLTYQEGFDPWGFEGSPYYLDQIHDLRAQYSGDLVSMFISTNATGGLGWLLNSASGTPDYGFCLVRVEQAGWTYTHIHEMGHNMGCHHHKAQNVQPGPGLDSYSAGWRWTGVDTLKYCSVMTYEQGTYFADNVTHTRVGYFSNPSITHQGAATGNSTDGDNARTLRETKQVVAGYRVPLAEALDNAATWTSGGNRRWYGQITTSHDTVDAARSGVITHNQESWMEMTTTSPSNLSFWWKVSSEVNDRLEFYIDGVLQDFISGSVDWRQETYLIASGSHTLKWRYVKNGSMSSGSDCGWVDDIVEGAVPVELSEFMVE